MLQQLSSSSAVQQRLPARRLVVACSDRRPPPPSIPPQLDRRTAITLISTAASTLALPTTSAAAAAAPAQPALPLEPLPVPPLTKTFLSPEGFSFLYPEGWVVAFDRSSSTNDGAVVVVGDFRSLITVSVFRITKVPEDIVRTGLNDASGYELCVAPQERASSTLRFGLLSSGMAASAMGDSALAYEWEYSIEGCVGEVEEGLGGALRCIGPFGNLIPTQKRRHIGKCVLIGDKAFSLNGSATEDKWGAVAPILRAVVSTFKA